ncbi:hypothetical protein [Caballeronia sp.]|uniref:amino acid kinase family protein n=1 Tax=Caballeronia sp. TaxID=1931223 RepID=UPI003C5F3D4B
MNGYEKLSVMKFGGSSFATRSDVSSVCQWLGRQLDERGPAARIVCVVSAPSGLTEQYRDTLLSFNPTPSDRLLDAGLPLADSLGAVLVAAALQALGIRANVALGNQIGLMTDRNYTRARLQSVDTEPLRRELVEHQIVLIPGGQAAAHETGETTWLGKNSSDLSAIALAAAFGCGELEIFSDVPGVYSCDPNVVQQAYLLPHLSYSQAVKMSSSGAKVLHHRGVAYAQQHGVRLICRSNRDDFGIGTILSDQAPATAAVIPDARSQVFSGSLTQLDQAAKALENGDIAYIRQSESEGRSWLAIPCGFFDATAFFKQHHVRVEPMDTQMISVLTETGELLHSLVSPAQLREFSVRLHQEYCIQTGPIVPCTPPRQSHDTEMLSLNLATFQRGEAARHV